MTKTQPLGERVASLEAVVPGMVEKVESTHTMVHEIKGTLDTFIKQMATADDRHTKLEVRTGKLENRQHWYSGAAAAIGVLAGAFGMHIKA